MTASRDRTARVWDARTGEPVTPPLRHPLPLLCAAISPDSRRILAGCGGNGSVFAWELPDNRRPVESLRRQAELLAGQRVDGAGVLISAEPAALRQDWQALTAAYPGDFSLHLSPFAALSELVPGNLLVNGGFEQCTPDTGLQILSGDAATGWTTTRGTVDIPIAPLIWAAEGRRCLDLDGDRPGTIAQTIRTVPGHRYRLRFCLAANPWVPPGTVRTVRVSAAGRQAEFSFQAAHSSARNPGWEVHIWEFTARAERTTLELASQSPPDSGGGPLLDNVSLVPVKPVR